MLVSVCWQPKDVYFWGATAGCLGRPSWLLNQDNKHACLFHNPLPFTTILVDRWRLLITSLGTAIRRTWRPEHLPLQWLPSSAAFGYTECDSVFATKLDRVYISDSALPFPAGSGPKWWWSLPQDCNKSCSFRLFFMSLHRCNKQVLYFEHDHVSRHVDVDNQRWSQVYT